MASLTNNWHYAMGGQTFGPLEFDELAKKAEKEEITKDTRVWPGEGEWLSAQSTSLGAYFPEEEVSTAPPPLTGENIDNKYVWAVAAVPIVGAVLEFLLADTLGLGTLLLFLLPNIALCSLDERKLKKAGHKKPDKFWVFIVPVYLWKRAGLVNQNRSYFWAWVVVFALSIVLSDVVFADIDREIVAESACETVSDIIRDNYGRTAQCKAVEIQNEIKPGFYNGQAFLDNGNVLPITIEEDEEWIYVTISN